MNHNSTGVTEHQKSLRGKNICELIKFGILCNTKFVLTVKCLRKVITNFVILYNILYNTLFIKLSLILGRVPGHRSIIDCGLHKGKQAQSRFKSRFD